MGQAIVKCARWWSRFGTAAAVYASLALIWLGYLSGWYGIGVTTWLVIGLMVVANVLYARPAVRAYQRLRESRRPKRHDPTDGCQAIHCYSCGIDEPGHGAYIVCGECGHVYPTARSLRRAYRRAVWQMIRNPYAGRGQWFTDDWNTGRFRQTWAMLTVRASKIYFCQLCIHDF